MELNCQLLTTTATLFALRAEWEQLWRRSNATTPFQSPAWLLPWWRVFGTAVPIIATLRDSSRLVGMLPLYVLDEPPRRKLLPIGAGITDYNDALLAPEAPAIAASLLLETALNAGREVGITECGLLDLPPYSPLRTAPVPTGWTQLSTTQQPCPVLSFPAHASDLRTSIPAGRCRDVRQYQNRAERIGGWSIEAATDDTIDSLLTTFFDLHNRRWRPRGEQGLLNDPNVIQFHRHASVELTRSGLLRLQVLQLADRPAAASYALIAGNDVMLYLGGFDPDFMQQSPATILLGWVIKQAIQEGRRQLHFLRGSEPYKHAWGAVDRMNTTRVLVPS